MRKLLLSGLGLLLASSAQAALSNKTVCVWNATGYKIPFQLEWDDLDPYTGSLQPGGWTADYWQVEGQGHKIPPLRLWFTPVPNTAEVDTAPEKAVVLAPVDTGVRGDCTTLRNVKLHYRIEEVYGSGTDKEKVTGFKLVGPMTNP